MRSQLADSTIREAIEGLLRAEGIRGPRPTGTAREFLTRARGEPAGCLILDVDLPGLSGLELQRETFRTDMHIPIIFLAGHGDIPMSVRAIKAGALEFLTKPFDPEDLLDAIQEGMLAREYRGSPITGGSPHSDEIVGASSAYRRVRNRIEMVAPTDSTVLIQGETGTGKELIAHEIHKLSRRKDQPLVRVNCTTFRRSCTKANFLATCAVHSLAPSKIT